MIDVVPLDYSEPTDLEGADELLHILYPGSSRRFQPDLRSDGVEVFLAKKADHQAVGLVVATFVHDGWEPYGLIDQLVVHPEYRLRGIGRHLVIHACRSLVEREAVVVFVTTNTAEAERFYRKVGFDSTGPWLARATHSGRR
ncbi:GNAT family N-acetyltransferase [Actinopolymorpha alba]|uniref:GNAT family N-acetyltransferase n=1 Tax=Actinopolymorpha alba TaxID=533267 RepID=UPI0012F6E2C8